MRISDTLVIQYIECTDPEDDQVVVVDDRTGREWVLSILSEVPKIQEGIASAYAAATPYEGEIEIPVRAQRGALRALRYFTEAQALR